MYYVLKIGDLYLQPDGTFGDSRQSALKIDLQGKRDATADAGSHDKGSAPRFVKIR